MRRRNIALVAFGVFAFATVLFLGWRRDTTNTFEAPFQPGGEITADLSIGGYTIRGTTDNVIRVEVDPSQLPDVRSEVKVNGTSAKVVVEGPTHNFSATIYVPQRSNIKAFQSIGQLRLVNVQGNQSLSLNIGQIQVELPDPAKLKSVNAFARIGEVHAIPWHRGHGGFFPSFRANGTGPYSVYATVDIGQVELGD
jgi:hypothetical protein